MLAKAKYWAALDEHNVIISIGITIEDKIFGRHCFDFSVQCMERWLLGGARYCSIQHPPLGGRAIARQKINVDNFSHGRIRTSKVGLSFLRGN